MARNYSQYSLKISPYYLNKLKYIANENGRSTNREIEQLIIRYINDYEKNYGEIDQEDIEYFFKSLK